MNSNIKIILDLDGSKAAETIDDLETRLDNLIKETTDPLKVNIEDTPVDSMKNLENISLLLKEVNDPAVIEYPAKESAGKSTNVKELKNNENDFQAHQVKLTGVEKNIPPRE